MNDCLKVRIGSGGRILIGSAQDNSVKLPILSTSDSCKVFVSYASANNEVANRLVEVILLCSSLTEEDIFCTASPLLCSSELKDNDDLLRGKCQEAEIFLYLVSKSYCDSENCLKETRWRETVIRPTDIAIHLEDVKKGQKPKELGNKNMARLDAPCLLSIKRNLEQIGVKIKEKLWYKKQTEFLSWWESEGQKQIASNESFYPIEEEGSQEYDPSPQVLEGIKALKALEPSMRKACIAEACGFVTMPDGSYPYAGKECYVKYAGVEYTYRRLKRDALLKVGKYETLSAPELLEIRNQNKGIHENWVRAQYYLQICKSEILEHFKKELKDIQG